MLVALQSCSCGIWTSCTKDPTQSHQTSGRGLTRADGAIISSLSISWSRTLTACAQQRCCLVMSSTSLKVASTPRYAALVCSKDPHCYTMMPPVMLLSLRCYIVLLTVTDAQSDIVHAPVRHALSNAQGCLAQYKTPLPNQPEQCQLFTCMSRHTCLCYTRITICAYVYIHICVSVCT